MRRWGVIKVGRGKGFKGRGETDRQTDREKKI